MKDKELEPRQELHGSVHNYVELRVTLTWVSGAPIAVLDLLPSKLHMLKVTALVGICWHVGTPSQYTKLWC